jgi:hypothetical protein
VSILSQFIKENAPMNVNKFSRWYQRTVDENNNIYKIKFYAIFYFVGKRVKMRVLFLVFYFKIYFLYFYNFFSPAFYNIKLKIPRTLKIQNYYIMYKKRKKMYILTSFDICTCILITINMKTY